MSPSAPRRKRAPLGQYRNTVANKSLENMNWFEKLFEYVSSSLLILIGVIGIIISVADFAGWETNLLSVTKEPLYLILLTIGALSLAIGLERVIRFRRIDQYFARIDNLLARSSGGCSESPATHAMINASIRV
ncbi:hypothetical protein DCC62_13020 [candidate division KSB1 bacterium]|nr:MAG: hypothetical protein DCC62_13020 [candidate division KSB1 bacterium]